MESGWFIEDIELPVGPISDGRNITRTFQSETLFQFFPSLTKSSARAFDYTFSGVIYPEHKAFALDQIARSADTNTVIITIPASEKIFNTTKFAVKNLKMSRKGPSFVKYAPPGSTDFKIVQAIPYSVTFTELPDEGEVQEGIDGFTDADESGIGLDFLQQLVVPLVDPDQSSGIALFGTSNLYQSKTGLPIIF